MSDGGATLRSFIEASIEPLPLTLDAEAVERLRTYLGTRTRTRIGIGSGAASAVIALLFECDADVHVWLLRRPDFMRNHAGQVAFPGGKQDPADPNLHATALREAEEEIGLAAAEVELVGQLDDLVTGTGFVVTPFIGWVSAAFTPVANADEVARTFSAPLRAFAAPPTGVFPHIGIHVEGEFVWGATLAMLRHLCVVWQECERG
jgi:8-oxo-dGTP pyrophosphatase MutT (NUDIX family)